MINERVSFQGSGGDRLSALVSRPRAGQPGAWALFAHCFTCSKDLNAVVNISRALTARRIGVFRFDFTGLGESEGTFEQSDFTSNVDDLLAASSFMSTSLASPAILIGHSLGGAAAVIAAGRMPSVRAVSTIGAPFDPGHVTHLFQGSMDEILARGEAEVVLAGRRFTVTRDFVEDVTSQRPAAAAASLGRPLLIFHAPRDAIVSIDNAARLFRAARHPKSFVSLDDADHLLTHEHDSRYVGEVIATWAARYIAR